MGFKALPKGGSHQEGSEKGQKAEKGKGVRRKSEDVT